MKISVITNKIYIWFYILVDFLSLLSKMTNYVGKIVINSVGRQGIWGESANFIFSSAFFYSSLRFPCDVTKRRWASTAQY